MKQARRITFGPECLQGAGLVDNPMGLGLLSKCNQRRVNFTTFTQIIKYPVLIIPVNSRRSFHTARQSCVINLNRPEQPVTVNTVKPVRPLRGGVKQRICDYCRNRQGADLPSVGNWSLTTGLAEVLNTVGVTNSPSLDELCIK